MLVSFLDNSGDEELNFRWTGHLARKCGVQPAECPQILWHCSRMCNCLHWEDGKTAKWKTPSSPFQPQVPVVAAPPPSSLSVMCTPSHLFFPATVAEFKQFYNQSEPFLMPKETNQCAGLCTQVFFCQGCLMRMHHVKFENILYS